MAAEGKRPLGLWLAGDLPKELLGKVFCRLPPRAVLDGRPLSPAVISQSHPSKAVGEGGMEVKHTLHLGNILGPLIRIFKNTLKFSLEGKKVSLRLT